MGEDVTSGKVFAVVFVFALKIGGAITLVKDQGEKVASPN